MPELYTDERVVLYNERLEVEATQLRRHKERKNGRNMPQWLKTNSADRM